jgi:holo-[acyl-carrier protein] synthase
LIALGTDILKVDRIEEMVNRLGDRFVRRILTEAEREEYAGSAKRWSRTSRLNARRQQYAAGNL